MNLFKRAQIGGGTAETIFINESYLMPDYVPTNIIHRDTEVNDMVYTLANLPKGLKAENLLLIGPPGTGKTLCSNHVLTELNGYTQKTLTLYLNCWEYSTRHSILNFLALNLGALLPPRGLSTTEITDRIREMLSKSTYNSLVIVLDEVDKLLALKSKEQEILYDLSRAKENFGINITIIGISNDNDVMVNLDARIRSSLTPRTILFNKYDSVALKEILTKRANHCFRPGVLGDEVIPLCAAIGVTNNGDARLSINALWKAGKLAERQASDKVTVEHILEVKKDLRKDIPYDSLPVMSKKIMVHVEQSHELTNTELYKVLNAEEKDKRTIRNHLDKLEKLGLIEINDTGHKVRVIKLK